MSALQHPEACPCWRCEETRMVRPAGHVDGCRCDDCAHFRAGPDGLSPFRNRAADPLVCEHPDDSRDPISGDAWLCGRCGAFVPPPSTMMRNDDLVPILEASAAEHREDVVLHALHVAGGAAAIGVEQVRPRAKGRP